ncbi:hypothetical protein BDZ94DRAFT_1301782 [Collybia nuda]|uniref:Transmembrane protein n=1 Tax=Collybia nuda TaxID=64659 RepID=A0A9P5XVL4_9AGAR|nr:hypothetical protein BDZ94DRAFT_1301782 [Collybia nuda]
MISTRIPLSSSFLFFLLITSSNAQMNELPNLESPNLESEGKPWRIIIGVIFGIMFLIFLIMVCVRIRRRRMGHIGTYDIMPIGARPLKPNFGRPWRRHNNITPPPPQQQQSNFDSENNASYNTASGFGHNAPVHPSPIQEPYNPEHSRPTEDPTPPPPYGTGMEPANLEQGGSYTPPPTPPPPAHTTGHKGRIAGGRS